MEINMTRKRDADQNKIIKPITLNIYHWYYGTSTKINI